MRAGRVLCLVAHRSGHLQGPNHRLHLHDGRHGLPRVREPLGIFARTRQPACLPTFSDPRCVHRVADELSGLWRVQAFEVRLAPRLMSARARGEHGQAWKPGLICRSAGSTLWYGCTRAATGAHMEVCSSSPFDSVHRPLCAGICDATSDNSLST